MKSTQGRLRLRRVGTTGIAGAALVVLALYFLGRTPWGTAEGPVLWTGDIHSSLNSQCFADPFTLVHFTHGLVLFLGLSQAARNWSATARFGMAYALEAIWEIVENTAFAIEKFRQQGMQQGYYGDSILNSVGDLFAAGLGVCVATALAARTSWRKIVGLIAGLEVLAWFWIRENVLLIAGRLFLKAGAQMGG